MIRFFIILGVLLFVHVGSAQELNCQVQINAQQTGQADLSVFKTLEKSLSEFVNETKWTNEKYEDHERINCTMFLTITDYNSGSFSATIQIQSSRPVFGSSMTSPIFNFKDNQFSFQYIEFEPLQYNPNSFESNLTSVVSYYVYTILGLDADTFSPLGGSGYFQEAQLIVGTAQQSRFQGWKPADGNQSRYQWSEDMLSPNMQGFREALYAYHRQGLDVMHEDVESGKQNIANAVLQMGDALGNRSTSIVFRSFFDAKANEIEKIFSDGPSVEITEVVETLNKLSPQNSNNWRNISY